MKPINKVLGKVAVWRMTAGPSYIRDRKTAGRSNANINRELDIIRGVLERAKRRHHFSEEIHPLTPLQNIRRALTYEEKVNLLHGAGTRPEWRTVACAARLALNTTMRGCEIKELRWRDVDTIGRSLAVRKSKTEAGERVIPLNADAWAVILELYRRS
ncbi:tyrosine-type recombinase/integrase [Granulicella aggregans]|uniref:tyrosine-type recombinase/integrase n=1 Tax=Granulicella aggregans TaxID=474949 RepID=UPI0021DFD6DF|nr:tyrosine-type recombinase/integrase [Granulicella aggregans]